MTDYIPFPLRSEREKEIAREATRRWRAAHPEKVKECNERAQARRREIYKTDEGYREACKVRSRSTPPSVQRERRAKLKNQVFDHYGRICACCGETEEAFLTVGHVNGDGAAHRKELSNGKGRGVASVTRVYLDIIRRGFPDDFRIECYNCNCGAFRNGGVCPHVRLNTVAHTTDASTDHLPSAPVMPHNRSRT